MRAFAIEWVRSQFPSLELSVDGQPAIFLDAPGGTQVPIAVTRAVRDYYRKNNSNVGGRFVTSKNTTEIVHQTRTALADFFHANRPEEIIFGQNMTSLTFAMSRALAKTWRPGSEIIVTSLDHDANISPWKLAAADRGCTVRTWEMRPEDCTLRIEDLQPLISEKTCLIAVTLASNAVGSHVDVARVSELLGGTGIKVFVDAVHFAPHSRIWFARPTNSLGHISVCSGENTNGWTNWRLTKCGLPQPSLRKNGKREPKASRASQELRVLSITSRKPDTKQTAAAELVERWK
jgi:selenocysteine lyase/cysteine desulfurase